MDQARLKVSQINIGLLMVIAHDQMLGSQVAVLFQNLRQYTMQNVMIIEVVRLLKTFFSERLRSSTHLYK